jgi:pilus assembly protein Flp/PilA
MKSLIVRFVREEEGQDIIEYALLAAFISIVAWSILVTIGSDVKTIFTAVDTVTGNAATAAS